MNMHRTVLLNETIEDLNLKPDSTVIDCTFGGGGHSLEIYKRFGNVKIIALDQDKSVFSTQGGSASDWKNCNISFVNENFRNIDKVLTKENIGQVDGIIFDLGLSSDQLENSGRGFSFLKDEPLLMTMKENPTSEDLTARDAVNIWSEKSLADVIYGYGEEKQAHRIAHEIVEFRKKQKIETTFDLVKIIEQAIPARFRRGKIPRKIHCATKTFQALRIAVNDELGALSEGLDKGFDSLKVGGRMSVISFHSLEDRIVKRFFSAKGGSASDGKEHRIAKIITKKPIRATLEEIKSNPRSRSAKLRILEKI
ncbi:16S rRNA (cytosine(1402)-N(4))-methyltransferase [Candidatus Nomurabacteria bacterium RIFCSPLOWO2_01_FULL_40_18]|uniref:Ribosomal RNA small subunit methyltransferase H n=1 Tax=Candidatus Nomurabacteria bacterium RIFCSPLOWO2_01_FULL_40_18 TaxID=1801773 RepID=A0A1F6XLI3_9BACT|nr:MAG: 16S rRNA (cytosine(1402)-N(4))-methyltransferase [Candidatus Nomurabacteria bacterium RIFCSPLOWO2_01_FULL_40_18]